MANKVEVVYSEASGCLIGTAVNDDPENKASTVSRGYTKLLRITDPEIEEPVTQAKVDAYAASKLREQEITQHKTDFSHAFVPSAKVGRCVRLDYTRFGYRADGFVVKQVLECSPEAIVKSSMEYEEAANAA